MLDFQYKIDYNVFKMIDKEEMGEQNFVENDLVILSKGVIDVFLKEENGLDLIGLYTFYYYTAKWQKTNQIKATDTYVRKGLNIGKDRLKKAKDRLLELGLIAIITTRSRAGGIEGWYIKLNYLWKNETVKTYLSENLLEAKPTCGKTETNALSTNNINALSTNIKKKVEVTQPELSLTLPLGGKTALVRIINYYAMKWTKKYGTSYTPNYKKLGGVLKGTMSNYNEYQIAFLIELLFQWKGATGDSQFIQKRLEDSCYPLEWLPSNVNAMIPYAKNKLGIDITNHEEVRRLIHKKLTQ